MYTMRNVPVCYLKMLKLFCLLKITTILELPNIETRSPLYKVCIMQTFKKILIANSDIGISECIGRLPYMDIGLSIN